MAEFLKIFFASCSFQKATKINLVPVVNEAARSDFEANAGAGEAIVDYIRFERRILVLFVDICPLYVSFKGNCEFIEEDSVRCCGLIDENGLRSMAS